MQSGDSWVFLFVMGLVVFNWPFLTMFEDSHSAFLFGFWFLFIAAIAALALYKGRTSRR